MNDILIKNKEIPIPICSFLFPPQATIRDATAAGRWVQLLQLHFRSRWQNWRSRTRGVGENWCSARMENVHRLCFLYNEIPMLTMWAWFRGVRMIRILLRCFDADTNLWYQGKKTLMSLILLCSFMKQKKSPKIRKKSVYIRKLKNTVREIFNL